MNCPTVDKLSQYVDELVTEQELADLRAHVKSCEECQRVVEAFMGEQQFLKETLQTPTLPDDFASSVLDQLEPYKEKRKQWNVWKRVMLTAAGVSLAVGLSATLNPSFAEWIGGMFSAEQEGYNDAIVDEGLRMATNAGLVERVNQEVTDNGLTFKVEDVVSDSSRVALSYQIIDKNGKPKKAYLKWFDSENKFMTVDQNGNETNGSIKTGWQEGSDYGIIEFSLEKQAALDQVTVKLELVELGGVKGNWNLEIPIDLTESRKLTTVVAFDEAEISRHGVTVQMKEFQFAPSSNEFVYETGLTKEEQEKVEKKRQQLKNEFGKKMPDEFGGYGTAIQYHIKNEKMETVYRQNMDFGDQEDSSGLLGGSGMGMEQLGQVEWRQSFIPQKEESKLTFVLDGVIKTVPSDFSITIQPKEIKKNPVSFEYEGNFITIKKAGKQNEYSLEKSILPIKKESIFTVELEGGKEVLAPVLGTWVFVDDKGKVYSTSQSGSILTEKDKLGRYKTTTEITTDEMDEIPDELTLHLLSVTRYEEVEDKWEVPLN